MIIGLELEQFLDEKGASPDCPKWVFPQGEDYNAYYNDNGLRLDENGLSCEGQKSFDGDMNPRCNKCPIRGTVFPEITYQNYVDVLYKKE